MAIKEAHHPDRILFAEADRGPLPDLRRKPGEEVIDSQRLVRLVSPFNEDALLCP
jgi:hypothetical protein